MNLPNRSFTFLSCTRLPPVFGRSSSLPSWASLIFLFVCFYGRRFCSPTINQTSLSQSKGWFSFILLCRRENIELVVGFTYKLHQHATIWGEMRPIFNFCGKHFWPIGKLKWLDKNIFHWIVETGLKGDFIMCHFLKEPWILKIVSCFCPPVLSTYHNGVLLVVLTHTALSFKKLISNTVVPNPYSRSSAFDPQSFTPLSFRSV